MQIAQEKKCLDPLILDLRGISSIADYFVIISGNSDRHVKALVNEIDVQLKHEGEMHCRKEIDSDYNWCIIDYGDVLVHIFSQKAREYYRLERLWNDAKEVSI